MGRVSNIFIALCVALLFSSCQTYRMIGIETYHAASITFPSDIQSIMIVNNTPLQSYDHGYHLVRIQNQDVSISTDSMAYLFCLSLGKAIAELPFFDDVRLCDDPLRSDSFFNMTRPLLVDDVERLCDEYDIDALISLDKLYFKADINTSEMSVFNYFISLQVEVAGELKALWPGGNVAHTIPFTDSLQLLLDPFSLTDDFLVQEVKEAIRDWLENTSQQMYKHFVPFWENDDRWFYTSMSSDWKRATAYTVANKWEEASTMWQSLYDNTSHKMQKARLASNLALAREIAGDLPKAIEYAEIAHSIFQEMSNEQDTFRQMQKNYLDLLRKRIEDDRKLSEQLRE